MSLVKDVERIGDYAKNVVEAREFLPAGLPDDARVTELKEIRGAVEGSFRDLARVFEEMDREEAKHWLASSRVVQWPNGPRPWWVPLHEAVTIPPR